MNPMVSAKNHCDFLLFISEVVTATVDNIIRSVKPIVESLTDGRVVGKVIICVLVVDRAVILAKVDQSVVHLVVGRVDGAIVLVLATNVYL